MNMPTQETHHIAVPLKQGDDDTFAMTIVHMLDPHAVVAYLWNTLGVKVASEHVREFWEHARRQKDPAAVAHPASNAHVPLGLYGDSARVSSSYDSDKVLGIYLNLPLWRPQPIRYSRFLLFAIEEKRLWKHHTVDAILRRITWSLNLLFTGKMPSEELICRDGTCFAVTEIRGDQLFHKETFRFTSSWTWKSVKVCYKCDARSKGPGPLYWDFDAWTGTEFSCNEFLSERMPSRLLCVSEIEIWKCF